MTARRLLLIGANAALVALLALTLQATPRDGRSETLALALRASSDPEPPTSEIAPSVAEAKPLFRPLPAPAVAPAAPNLPPAAPSFRLAGILWGEAERLALVQLADEAGHRRIRLGEAVDDWRLSDLTQRSATFDADRSRRVVLMLTRQAASDQREP